MTPGPGELPAPQRVVIVKPSALGDVVTALPVLRGLRRTFPHAHIAWVLRDVYAPLLSADEDLDERIVYDRDLLGRAARSRAGLAHLLGLRRGLRQGRFDWAIDLQGLLRSGLFSWLTGARVRAGFADAREGAGWFYTHRFELPVEAHHTVERNVLLARTLGVDARGEDLRLELPRQARREAGDLLEHAGVGGESPFVAMVPRTRWTTKNYAPRHWRRVAAALGAEMPVVVLGSGSEREACRAIAAGVAGARDLSGGTSLAVLAAVLERASLAIGGDSAFKFIAQATGTPPLVIVGPTRPERTGPYPGVQPAGRTIGPSLPCQGCLRKRCRHVTCMEVIAPGEVIELAREMLSRDGSGPGHRH